MKTGLPSICSIGHTAHWVSRSIAASQGSVWLISACLLTVGAPDHRSDAGGLARPDHRRAGPVGEDERGRPVVLSVMSLSRSTPMISTYFDAPLRMNESAIAVA